MIEASANERVELYRIVQYRIIYIYIYIYIYKYRISFILVL